MVQIYNFVMTTQKKIVILHKDATLVEVLADMVRALGHIPHSKLIGIATTPTDVVSFVRDSSPDLVLLAENFGGGQHDPAATNKGVYKGEGIEALVAIRNSGYTMPVFMVSGGPQYHEEAIRRGANGYLEFPFTQEGFRKLIE